jgi:hypothetical protein
MRRFPNEFRTSKLCNKCHSNTENFKPKPICLNNHNNPRVHKSVNEGLKILEMSDNQLKFIKGIDRLDEIENGSKTSNEIIYQNIVNRWKKDSHEHYCKTDLVWGLVCCTNINCKPKIKPKRQINKYGSNVYNRDTNAVLNMLYIVKELIITGKRPNIFSREIVLCNKSELKYY